MISRFWKQAPPASIVRRTGRTLVFAFACTAPLVAAPATAGLVIEIQNFDASPGSFDVVLVNNDATSYHVASDVVEIAINGATGAAFTDATTATAVSYIYSTSFADYLGIPLYAGLTGTDLTVVDSEFADPFYRVVGPGESYGLAHVTFIDDPRAPLTVDMISIVPEGTTISDENNNIIYPASPVPEPSTCMILSTGFLCMIVYHRKHIRLAKG